MELIDFDKLYQEYVKEWMKKNAAKLKKSKQPEEFIEEIYTKWRDAPAEEIGGISPVQYFEKLSAKESLEMLKAYTVKNMEVPSTLLDRISECGMECEGILIEFLTDKESGAELTLTSANLLEEIGSKKHIGILADMLIAGACGKELEELAVEILSQNAEEVENKLLPYVKDELDWKSVFLADILVYAKGKQKVYSLLVKLFESGKNNQLYAAYLGAYGDPRAIPLLEKRLYSPDLGYVEFLEIRNSIERLGGEVTLEKDFSGDPDYKALKNVKN